MWDGTMWLWLTALDNELLRNKEMNWEQKAFQEIWKGFSNIVW